VGKVRLGIPECNGSNIGNKHLLSGTAHPISTVLLTC
jgi:hypothetical protein